MNTMQFFAWMSAHPYHAKGFKKLTRDELVILADFLAHEFPDKNVAMHHCNRMFMDNPAKPKNWTMIMEAASVCIMLRFP